MVVKEKDKTIIWDWNGTLLNDVKICIECINILLKKYHLNKVSTRKYKEIFAFPVQSYYQVLGFDFTKIDFSVVAAEFIREYLIRLPNCNLYPGAEEKLNDFKRRGFDQIILSAMEQKKLYNSVKSFKIDHFFDSINGLDNNHATSKLNAALKIFKNKKLNPEKTWIIGDTVHDFEIAQILKVNHFLISNGHQSYTRLSSVSNSVFNRIFELNI